ncbi:predicted protein [Postia placenta Mad-698-R]|nr:predicted protein [Postia placenta Mad-698-R]
MPTPTIISAETRRFPPISYTDQSSGTPVQYKVVEQRRTVYMASNVPPDQLDPQVMEQFLSVPDVPGQGYPTVPPMHHRTISLQEADRRQGGWEDLAPQPSPTCSEPAPDQRKNTRPSLLKKTKPKPQFTSTSPITPTSPQRSPHTPRAPARILFYNKDQPYYGFTNFSTHSVLYNNKSYPTSEHLFQSFKFQKHRPLLAEHIRTCSDRPSVAFSEARRFQSEMDETLWHKFTQHRNLMEELLATGDAELVEQCNSRPKNTGHEYCGRKCAKDAKDARDARDAKAVVPTDGQPTMTIANNVAPTGAPTQTASNLVHHIQIRHTPPRFGNAMQPPRETKAPQTTQLQSATQRSVAQAPYLLKGASAASTGITAVSNRTVWATPPASLPVSANVAPAPSFNVPPVAGQQPTHRGVAVPVQPLPPSTCSLQSCSRPAHVNSDGSVSGYCTMNHREEAVTSGAVPGCIMCGKYPQSATDYFCSTTCREQALRK